MKAASLFDPNLVVTTSVPTTVTLGGTLFTDLLARTSDIDAVFCVNDLEFAASAVPSLSSVRTNRYEMGRHAVSMAIDAIEGRRPKEPVIDLGFQLMVRESSTPQGA